MTRYRLYIEFEAENALVFNRLFNRISKAVRRYLFETFGGEVIRIELDVDEFAGVK